MRLGLLTDIHDHVEYLRMAIARLRGEGVDQFVVLGDLTDRGDRIEETCELLREVDAVGVWGNHDFGLCFQPDEALCQRFGESVMSYMATLKPRLELGGCHFSHLEPWLDPEDLADLWYVEGPLDEPWKRERIFNAVPHRLMFAGHYHRWLRVLPDRIDGWNGDAVLDLSQGRSFVVIDAVMQGRYALLDTETWLLQPFQEESG